MDVALRFLLFQQDPGLDRAVVGAAEQGGQGDHIDVIRAALVGVQIALGGGAGGGGASSLCFMAHSRSLRSREASSTKELFSTRMVSGTFTKWGSFSICPVKSQQLSTTILKLILFIPNMILDIRFTILYHSSAQM